MKIWDQLKGDIKNNSVNQLKKNTNNNPTESKGLDTYVPSLFIGITTYNNLDNFESIKEIADSEYDYLVVDDYSDDGLVLELERNQIKYLQPDKKIGGPGKSRNMIIEYASKKGYDFITFCDGDDEFDLSELRNIIKELTTSDQFVFTQMLTWDNDVCLIPVNSAIHFAGKYTKEKLVKQHNYTTIFNSNGGRIYNLDFIVKNNLQYIDDQPGQDTHFNMLCFKYAENYNVIVDKNYYLRNIDENSLSNNFKFDSFNSRIKTIRQLAQLGTYGSKWKHLFDVRIKMINNLDATLKEKELLLDTLFAEYDARDLFTAEITPSTSVEPPKLNHLYTERCQPKLGIFTYCKNHNVISSFSDVDNVDVVTYVSISELKDNISSIVERKQFSSIVYFHADLERELDSEVVAEYVTNLNTKNIVIPKVINSQHIDIHGFNHQYPKNEYSLMARGLPGIDGLILPKQVFRFEDADDGLLLEQNISLFIALYGRVTFNANLKFRSKSYKESQYKLNNFLTGNRKILIESYQKLNNMTYQSFFYNSQNSLFANLIGFNKFTAQEQQLISYSIDNSVLDQGFYVTNKHNEIISIYLTDDVKSEIDFNRLICYPLDTPAKYQIYLDIYKYELKNIQNIIQGNLPANFALKDNDVNSSVGIYYDVKKVNIDKAIPKLGTIFLGNINMTVLYDKKDFILGSLYIVSLNNKTKLLQSKDYIRINPCDYILNTNPKLEIMFMDKKNNIIQIGQIDEYLELRVIIITKGEFKIPNKNLLQKKNRFILEAKNKTIESLMKINNHHDWAYCLSDKNEVSGCTMIDSSLLPIFSSYYSVEPDSSTRPIIISTSMLNHKSLPLENVINRLNRWKGTKRYNFKYGLLVDDSYLVETNKKCLDFDFYIYTEEKTCYKNEYLLNNQNDITRLKHIYGINQPIVIETEIKSNTDLNRLINLLECQENRLTDKFIIKNKYELDLDIELQESIFISYQFDKQDITYRPRYTIKLSMNQQYSNQMLSTLEKDYGSSCQNQYYDLSIKQECEKYSINTTPFAGKSIAVIVRSFPTHEDLYSNQYVMTRILEYKKLGYHCEVYSKTTKPYIINGIKVMPIQMIKPNKESANRFGYTNAHIHTLRTDLLLGTTLGIPVTIFSHGVDAFSYHTREHNIVDLDFKATKKLIDTDFTNQRTYIDAYNNTNGNCEIIFTSNWLKDEFIKHYGLDQFPHRVVSNYIDSDFFEYREKDFSKIKFLTIKSFANYNYANDILIDTIVHLADNYENFEKMVFTIIGDGKLFDKQTKSIAHFSNVNLIKGFLTRDEIKQYHQNHNVGIYVTRADTQGISRNEAMASGLLTISTKVQAIPEFSSDKSLLIENNTVEELSAKLIDVFENRNTHREVTKADREFVVSNLSKAATLDKDHNSILN